MSFIEIETSLLPDIMDFILKSKNELQEYDLKEEEIEILMPEYIFQAFRYYYEKMVSRPSTPSELNNLYNLKINFHYKDEIVVYTPIFYKNLQNLEKIKKL